MSRLYVPIGNFEAEKKIDIIYKDVMEKVLILNYKKLHFQHFYNQCVEKNAAYLYQGGLITGAKVRKHVIKQNQKKIGVFYTKYSFSAWTINMISYAKVL